MDIYFALMIANICFVILTLLKGLKSAFVGSIIVFLACRGYELQHRKCQEKKRSKYVTANVLAIESDNQNGHETYSVVCGCNHFGKKYMFQSLFTPFALNVDIGQEIEVLVDPKDYSNYYVDIGNYIIIDEKSVSNISKKNSIDLVPDTLQDVEPEKQRVMIIVLVIGCFSIVLSTLLAANQLISDCAYMAILGMAILFVFMAKDTVGW